MNNIRVGNYRRVSKQVARRIYNGGGVVRLTACKMSPVNVWGAYTDATPERLAQVSTDGFNVTVARNREFETVVNAFQYYNCNNECGRYAAYYIEEV